MTSLFDSSPHATLRSLYWLHWCLLVAGLAAIGLAGAGFYTASDSLYLAVALLLFLNLATAWRLGRDKPVSQYEILVHLLLDALILTVFLVGSGGAANPFVSLYLLPVAMAGVTLPSRMAWAVLICGGGLHSFLIYRLLSEHVQHQDGFLMHILGMWANYWIAAVLIVVFVGALLRRLQQRDEALAAARSAQMRNEQVVSLGALAAATVHELGGPLSSIDMLAEAVQKETGLSLAGQEDLSLLREQLQVCRTQLDELLRDTGQGSSPGNWAEFLRHAVERFRALRPEIRVEMELRDGLESALCEHPQGLMLWLWGLLNNAADASLESQADFVTLHAELGNGHCRIEVIDAGAGMSSTDRPASRQPSNKGPQRGWGLLLGHAGIESLGGKLEFADNAEAGLSGTRAIVTLPLSPA